MTTTTTTTTTATATTAASESQKTRSHPLHEIAESASHRLLLKQWLKEEDLISARLTVRQSRLDAVRKEITFLYCSFFVFHSLVVLLLFSTSASAGHHGVACRRSWIPCLCSFFCSLGIAWAVRYKSDTEAVLERMAEREEEDAGLLGKCVSELRLKGAEFDLLREVDALRRAKSLRSVVDGKGPAKVRKFSSRDIATLALLALSCGVLALTRSVLCS